MVISRNIIFLTVLIAAACYKVECWSIGQILGDLPIEIIEDILTILIKGTVQLTGDCSNANNASQVEYCLFTRENPNNSTILTSPDQIDGSKPVIILIHGWGGNCDIDYIHVIKDAYIKRYDATIISVDYSVYASGTYQTSYCHVPAIGLDVAQLICNISTTHNINMSSIHVVGHSLGGQVAGFAGKETQKICGTIGRITALDPAGPLYQSIDHRQRLDKSDATFVDVIHTNEGQFGYIGDCGDVDFYPNCGYFQPGCTLLIISEIASIGDILNIPLDFVHCNHQRSCYLFAESININRFYATSCTLCGTPICYKGFINPDHTYMGESCRSQTAKIEYTLSTNGHPPYAKGPQGSFD